MSSSDDDEFDPQLGTDDKFARFLVGRRDPDGARFDETILPPQERKRLPRYEKLLHKAGLNAKHLVHVRRFKPLAQKADEADFGIADMLAKKSRAFRNEVEATNVAEEEEMERLMSKVQKMPIPPAPPGLAADPKPKLNSQGKTPMPMHLFFKRWTGGWKKGSMHGHGKYTFAVDGLAVDGAWSQNRLNGKGRTRYLDGSSYEGEYKEGLFHGQGTLTFASGSVYAGEWRHGLRHGVGVQTWPSGQRYEGKFYKGDMHGRGVLSSAAGHEYRGEMRMGLIQGVGRLRFATGPSVLKNWPRCTMREAVLGEYTDARIKALANKLELDELLAKARKFELDDYIEAVRDHNDFMAAEEKRLEIEERRRLELLRREKIRDAKLAAMEAMEREEAEDAAEGAGFDITADLDSDAEASDSESDDEGTMGLKEKMAARRNEKEEAKEEATEADTAAAEAAAGQWRPPSDEEEEGDG
jgi:hypothetical protein